MRARVFLSVVAIPFHLLTSRLDAHADDKSSSSDIFQKDLITGLNITQNSFSNWSAGGEDALSYSVSLDPKIDRQKDKYRWRLAGAFAFGQTKVTGEALRNTVDKIELEGSFTYKAGAFVDPYASASVNTQFTTGYDYSKKPEEARSDFLDPVYVMQSVGGGVTLANEVKTRVGLAFKETFTDEHRKYSDDPKTPEQEKAKWETGIESRSDVKTTLSENVAYESRLELFSAFEHIEIVDVKWKHLVTAKFNKYVTMKLDIQVLYDRDITLRTQIKQVLAVGFTYNFL